MFCGQALQREEDLGIKDKNAILLGDVTSLQWQIQLPKKEGILKHLTKNILKLL